MVEEKKNYYEYITWNVKNFFGLKFIQIIKKKLFQNILIIKVKKNIDANRFVSILYKKFSRQNTWILEIMDSIFVL